MNLYQKETARAYLAEAHASVLRTLGEAAAHFALGIFLVVAAFVVARLV